MDMNEKIYRRDILGNIFLREMIEEHCTEKLYAI